MLLHLLASQLLEAEIPATFLDSLAGSAGSTVPADPLWLRDPWSMSASGERTAKMSRVTTRSPAVAPEIENMMESIVETAAIRASDLICERVLSEAMPRIAARESPRTLSR